MDAAAVRDEVRARAIGVLSKLRTRGLQAQSPSDEKKDIKGLRRNASAAALSADKGNAIVTKNNQDFTERKPFYKQIHGRGMRTSVCSTSRNLVTMVTELEALEDFAPTPKIFTP
ncbi:hypothetical protein HPB50_006733 [Hyalomma asiaticum]|uniref:Uncharacterized protein n=1 Tax=Hyalomma asiaticum TaxID=266040 RepID=A0ACB7SVS7_HYAAI|nr:hypothetical protein HPB50_006733 [Hyalomma asiaticum]